MAGGGGLGGVHACSESGFFEEVAPTFVSVRRGLTVLIFTHGGFGVLASVDNFDYSSGHIGAYVVADQNVRRFRIVGCQRGSVIHIGG